MIEASNDSAIWTMMMLAQQIGKAPFRLAIVVTAVVAVSNATATMAADPASPDNNKKTETIIHTGHGPVKGIMISPGDGSGGPNRARPPIRIIVPQQPIEPPHKTRQEPPK